MKNSMTSKMTGTMAGGSKLNSKFGRSYKDRKHTATYTDCIDMLHLYKVVEIKFLKKDGTLRDMVCTNDPQHIPEEFLTKEKEQEKPSVFTEKDKDSYVKVFDLDKMGWRQFKPSNLLVLSHQSVIRWDCWEGKKC